MSLLEVLELVNAYLWYVALVVIVIMGVVCTVALRGVQFRSIKDMWHCTFGSAVNKEDDGEKRLSSFQVFCMSMGSRIGVGNITGPVLAILTGGPGAILWMWIFALIGMATSFVETTLGQIYKSRTGDGHYHGGMAFGITKALGNRKMGAIVAFIMILMYLVGFISMEVVSITETVVGAAGDESIKPVFAVIFTLFVGVILLGGVQRVANISTKIVPAMAVLWIGVCLITIALHGSGIIGAFSEIFGYAFVSPECLVGGGIGAVVMAGMKRGVMSNEAGIGTIPNLSSMSDVKHPVSQGMSQALGVFIDLLVSTMTALVILTYADFTTLNGLNLESMPLLQEVLGDSLGAIAPYVVLVFMFLFAFTCLMSDYIIGENNLSIIVDHPKVYPVLFFLVIAVVFISAFYASDELFVVVDIMLAICAFANTYFLFKLGGRALEAYRDYAEQKRAGVSEPVFRRSCLSDSTGVTEWDD